MSMKDVINYQWSLQAQYVEMKDNLDELTKLVEENVVAPERLDQLKQLCETIKTNKDRVDYIVYLLHKPVKGSKQQWYSRRNEKLLKEMKRSHSTLEDVKAENKECLDKMKEII